MEEKTPTERVRTMLDEQGVEYHELKVNECTSFCFDCCPQCDDYRNEIIVAGEYIEVAQKYLSPEQAIAATVGSGRVSVAKQMRTALESRRTCAECPEMDNPDSYIRHLQSALKWHDEHVPRPTNPRNTCVVLCGKKPPEEVLFVREDGGGVTHYLPEDAGTCKRVYHPNRITKKCTCSNCGYGASDERWAYCPKCGHKYVHGEVEERWKRAGRKVAE